jgi:hypothetical protein
MYSGASKLAMQRLPRFQPPIAMAVTELFCQNSY